MDCKRILTFLFLPALLVLSGTGCQGEARRTGEEAFTVTRGLNISHWLSQSQVRGAARVRYFTEKDVKYIASEGFDHVRIMLRVVFRVKDRPVRHALRLRLAFE